MFFPLVFLWCCHSCVFLFLLLFLVQTGSHVEVKTPDGKIMDGVIIKLTDASAYTVGKYSGISKLKCY